MTSKKTRTTRRERFADNSAIVKPRVVIPSIGRSPLIVPGSVFPGATLCVPKNQFGRYHDEHPKTETVAYPSDVVGFPAVRRWIYDRFGNVFMLSDKVIAIERTYLNPQEHGKRRQLTSREASDVLIATATTAYRLGAYLFGFLPPTDARRFRSWAPFRLTGLVHGSGFGILSGSRITFDDNASITSDVFASLMNAHAHRYVFVDERFVLRYAKQSDDWPGGLASVRTAEVEEQNSDYLVECFGDAIQIKRPAAVASARSAPRPGRDAHRRTIKVRF